MTEPSAPRSYRSPSFILVVLALFCAVIFTLIAHGTFKSDEGFTWLGASLSFYFVSLLL